MTGDTLVGGKFKHVTGDTLVGGKFKHVTGDTLVVGTRDWRYTSWG